MATSTLYNQAYDRAKYMNQVTVKDQQVLDVLSQKVNDFVRYVNVYTKYTYSGEPITTIAYRFYGTPTLWWVIIAYTGLYSPMDLVDGMTLKVPDKAQIDEFINRRSIRIAQRVYI